MTKNIIKILTIIIVFFSIFTFDIRGAEATETVNLYFFESETCPHCHAEKEFLEKISPKYPNLKIHDFEVTKSRQNALLLQKVGKLLDANISGVPFTVIGDKYYVGFGEGTTDKIIEERIAFCSENSCPDSVGASLGITNEENPNEKAKQKNEGEDKDFNIPILGEITAKTVSLPLLTIALGFVDGFNPCAMWILIFLISLLIGMENRFKKWTLGFAFIFASAFVYFMFMSLWLNLIIFLGFILWIRISIGLVSLFGGAYGLKKGLETTMTCEVTSGNRQQKIFDKLKTVIHQESFVLALVGIVILAFLVNLVELICSAGLPAIYTQILALNNLNFIQYYLYILLYVFFFMLDDLIVFIVSMKALEITGITTKYSKLTRIIGGVLMIIIGILLIFKPEWVMFN